MLKVGVIPPPAASPTATPWPLSKGAALRQAAGGGMNGAILAGNPPQFFGGLPGQILIGCFPENVKHFLDVEAPLDTKCQGGNP